MKWITLIVLFFSPLSYAEADLKIALPNGTFQTLSVQQIESQLEPQRVSTPLPWYKGTRNFTAIKLSSLLDYFHVKNAKRIKFKALNDYVSVTPVSDIQRYQPYLAFEMDGKRMRVRDKGPFWLIYDLSKTPSLDTEYFRQQMTWQIATITIE